MKTPVWTHPPFEKWSQCGPVHANVETAQIDQLESTSEARIADPVALGFFGLAIGTTLAAWVLAGWAPMPAGFVAATPVLLLVAGVAQFVAGLFAFVRTRTWQATTMCVYGAMYGALALSLWGAGAGVLPAAGSNVLLAVGLFCASYISLALAVAASRLHRSYALMTAMLGMGFVLSGVQALGANRELGFLGGYFLLVAAFFAFYAATAHVVNSAWRRQVFPL